MRGRKRSDLSNNDNHENDDGNKWYRDLNIVGLGLGNNTLE